MIVKNNGSLVPFKINKPNNNRIDHILVLYDKEHTVPHVFIDKITYDQRSS